MWKGRRRDKWKEGEEGGCMSGVNMLKISASEFTLDVYIPAYK